MDVDDMADQCEKITIGEASEAWKLGMGVCFSEIESNRFLIQFRHEADVRRVLDGGPWSLNNNMLLIGRVFPGEDPIQKPICHISLWLQAHDIPARCMSKSVAQLLGRAAGEVIEVVPNNFNGYKRSFMRLRTEPMMIPRSEKRSPEEGGFPKRREGQKGTSNDEAIHVAQGSRGCMGNISSMQECGDNRAADSGLGSGKDIMRREVSLQLVWDHKLLSPIEMLRLSNGLINCWDCALASLAAAGGPREVSAYLEKWHKSVHNWRTLSVDAATFERASATSLVCRDDKESFCGAKVVHHQFIRDPIILETIAIREALTWIKERNRTRFVIESDCWNVVFAINNLVFYDSYFGLMVIDCRDLLTTLVDVQVVHIRRSANQVAHKIVRAFGSLPGLHIWGLIAPDCILAELAHDLME